MKDLQEELDILESEHKKLETQKQSLMQELQRIDVEIIKKVGAFELIQKILKENEEKDSK